MTGNRTDDDHGGKMTRLVLILNNSAVALQRFVWKVEVARPEIWRHEICNTPARAHCTMHLSRNASESAVEIALETLEGAAPVSTLFPD